MEDLNKKVGLNIDDKSLLLSVKRRKSANGLALPPKRRRASQSGNRRKLCGHSQLWWSKGNEITIQVAENVLDSTKRDVITYLGTDIVDKQVVTDVKDLVKTNTFNFLVKAKRSLLLERL